MDDAYEKIGNIVEQWCKENMYTTMLVTISIGYEWETPHEETHLLEWDCENHCLVWDRMENPEGTIVHNGLAWLCPKCKSRIKNLLYKEGNI